MWICILYDDAVKKHMKIIENKNSDKFYIFKCTLLFVHAWLKYIAVNKSNNVSAPQLQFLQGCHRVSNRLESNTASRQLENPHDPSYPENLQNVLV